MKHFSSCINKYYFIGNLLVKESLQEHLHRVIADFESFDYEKLHCTYLNSKSLQRKMSPLGLLGQQLNVAGYHFYNLDS